MTASFHIQHDYEPDDSFDQDGVMDRENRAEIICNLSGMDPNNEEDWEAALVEADQQIVDGFEYE